MNIYSVIGGTMYSQKEPNKPKFGEIMVMKFVPGEPYMKFVYAKHEYFKSSYSILKDLLSREDPPENWTDGECFPDMAYQSWRGHADWVEYDCWEREKVEKAAKEVDLPIPSWA